MQLHLRLALSVKQKLWTGLQAAHGSSCLYCREASQARSLDQDWRSSKGKGGPPPGPSSKEWVDGYHNQPAEAAMRTAASSDQPDSHPRDRASHDRAPHDRAPRDHQRGGSRNNPEWMSDGGAAGAEDAAGLTAGARRAKDFESERQRMKEEWKKEQAQLKGTTYQPVCLKIVDSQLQFKCQCV